MKKIRIRDILAKIVVIAFMFTFLVPFFLVMLYSVKSKSEMITDRLSFPTTFHWENFTEGIAYTKFWHVMGNSLIVTSLSIILITIVCTMAAYIIARKRSLLYNFVYYLFVGAMIIPFQSIMTPLYKMLVNYGLVNTLGGFVIVKSGVQIAFTVLIITGFVNGIPRELEEAAFVDGAGRYKTFFAVVLPLMKPILFTSLVLNILNVWNDFQVSVVLLQKIDKRTIPLVQFYLLGERANELNQAFAVFLLSMIPVLIIYLIFQKYIIQGVTAGAVKG